MSEWKPGDVAMVQCSDGEWRRATCLEPAFEQPAWVFADNSRRRASESTARPLVVIDPAATKGGALLPGWLRFQASDIARASAGGIASVADDLRYIADQIELACKPPRLKPSEPTGLGAVVRDEDGEVWVLAPADTDQHLRTQRGEWVCSHSTGSWSGVDAVEVLSEGWSE